MSLLFFLTNTSANQVHWVIPNTDESGKKVAPTPWVQRYHHRWREEDLDSAWCQRAIPRGPAEQASFLYHLDPEEGRFLAPQYAALLRGSKPDELPKLQSDVSDRRQEQYGWVRPAAISKSHRPISFSVTELEFLAKCPYRFYAHSLAGWKAIRPQLFSIEPDALEWGRLVHSHLESLLAPVHDRNSLLSSVLTTRIEGVEEDLLISRIVESLPFSLRLLPGPLQIAAARRLVFLAKAYHAAIGESCEEARPVFRELKIRLPFPGREYLTISGQIDRVDDRDGEAHVVDYKSGVIPWANRKQKILEISLGFRLQPLLYPWLYQQQEHLSRAPGFSFVFLGEIPPREVAVSSTDSLEELLFSLVVLLEQGIFPATPDELMAGWGLGEARPCSFCDYTSLCRRFDETVQTQHKARLEADGHERMTLLTRAARGVE
jgi:hypothetical protein